MVRVGVELGVRGCHPAHPRDRSDAAETPSRRRHAAADACVRQDGVDRLVPRVEQVLDVDRRPRRPKPEALVRLVPDQPVANPGVTLGGRVGEARKSLGLGGAKFGARPPFAHAGVPTRVSTGVSP